MNSPRSSSSVVSIFIFFVVCTFQTIAVAQGVFLRAGDSYLFTFDSVSYLQEQQYPFPYDQQFSIRHPAGTLTEGDSYKLELFTNISTAPFTTVWSIGVLPPGHTYVIEPKVEWSDVAPPMFPELRGAARITVENGDIEIDQFYVQQVVNGQVYAQYYPVPEPSTVVLGGAGVLFLVLWRQRRR